MNFRAIVTLVILVALAAIVLAGTLVAAACGGSSESSPTATLLAPTMTPEPATDVVAAFKPVEEVLTPPPDIDTSGCLTHRDDPNGFELKYPPDAKVRRDFMKSGLGFPGRGTQINLPITPGTTLFEAYLFIEVSEVTAGSCVPPQVLSTPNPRAATPSVRLIHASAIQFWKTRATYAGGGGATGEETYWTAKGNYCVKLTSGLAGGNRGSYADPPPTPDNRAEADRFAAMLSTFRWLD